MQGMDQPEKDWKGKDLPSYTCNKRVWALKIKEVLFYGPGEPTGAQLNFEGGHAPVGLGGIALDRTGRARIPQRTLLLGYHITGGEPHNLQAGDCWVTTEDGCEACCPAKAFELSYTRDKTPKRSVKRGVARRPKPKESKTTTK